MTKRCMAKKFMRETGADKKTAMDYLRMCHWNYGQAKLLWNLPDVLSDITERIKKIDWTETLASVAKAIKDTVKIVAEAMQKVDWNEEIKKLQEERGESNEDSN